MPGQVTSEVLSRFGENLRLARWHYRSFVRDGVGVCLDREAEDDSTSFGKAEGGDPRTPGEDAFVDALLEPARFNAPQTVDFNPETLLSLVADELAVDSAALKGPGRTKKLAEARALFCCLAVNGKGRSCEEVAGFLGMSRAGVSVALRRGESIFGDAPSLWGDILGKLN